MVETGPADSRVEVLRTETWQGIGMDMQIAYSSASPCGLRHDR